MNNKGFTLVEVLAVVAILAIISLIVAPSVINSIDKGKGTSDRVLYGNIKTAISTMYEEIDYGGSDIYIYTTTDGKKKNEKIEISDENGGFETNIQTLVGNGFLNGINNFDADGNKYNEDNSNTKIVVNADGVDIGMCEVSIFKKVDTNSKVCYKVYGDTDDNCPTTEDFGGDDQCS